MAEPTSQQIELPTADRRVTAVNGWSGVDDGRFWSGTYRARGLALVALSLASAMVGGYLSAIALLVVVSPFNAVAALRHRRHGRAPVWLPADLVLAAIMAALSPIVFAGSVMCVLTNSVTHTLATDERTVRRFSFAALATYVGAGIFWHQPALVVFGVATGLGSHAITRVVGYLLAKQFAASSRMEAILDGINAAICEIDIERGAVLYANRHAVEMVGFVPTSADALLEVIHPDDRPAVSRIGDDALRSSEPSRVEIRMLTGGSVRFIEVRATVSHRAGKKRLRVVFVDVSDRKSIENELAHRALHDALTDLPNRLLIRQRMDAALAETPAPHAMETRAPNATDEAMNDAVNPVRADEPTLTERIDADSGQREHGGAERSLAGRTHAVLLLDLDSFKDVNDALGHHHGDLLLVEIADRLRKISRPVDTIARLGGDEFAVWLDGVSKDTAREIADRIRREIAAPYTAEGVTLTPDVSIGIACYPDDGQTAADLMRLADVAMYRAKRSGTGYAVYSLDFDADGSNRLLLLSELREALASGQIEPHFQPLVDSGSGRIASCEALARWIHPTRGILTPSEFWPLIQATGLSRDVAKVVLESVFDRLHTWILDDIVVPIAVNLTAGDIADTVLMDWFKAELVRRELPHGLLSIELTEAEIVSHTKATRATLYELRELGVTTSVDDFGTGYSSLVWLRDLPISTVKIDRSFVENLCVDDRTRAIVKSTIDLAHELRLSIVGEGVEDEATASTLDELGCNRMQGYYFSRPVTPTAMETLLRSGLHRKSAVMALGPPGS